MSLAVLRRSRLLAGLLFAASPALGGTLLPAIHPCPVDSPWLAHHEAAGHNHHAPDPGTNSHESQTCHCIGSWLSGTAMAPPRPVLVAGRVTLHQPVLLPAHDSSLDLRPRSALLPPATAPPLV